MYKINYLYTISISEIFKMIKFTKNISLANYTVIIPSVGVGNVAQLSSDLLISTLKMEKVATIWHSAIIPIIGPSAFDHDTDSTTTSSELYVCEEKKIAVIQLRSPLVAILMIDFFTKLIELLISDEHKIAKVFVLTSSYAYENHVIEKSPFEYIANELYKQNTELNALGRIGWNEFDGDIIHGGGFAQKLLTVATEKGLSAIVLFKYVSEGDNTPDATHFVAFVNSILNILPRDNDGQIKLSMPISWKLLFGNSPPEHVY